jgi:hypothetical protein
MADHEEAYGVHNKYNETKAFLLCTAAAYIMHDFLGVFFYRFSNPLSYTGLFFLTLVLSNAWNTLFSLTGILLSAETRPHSLLQ